MNPKDPFTIGFPESFAPAARSTWSAGRPRHRGTDVVDKHPRGVASASLDRGPGEQEGGCLPCTSDILEPGTSPLGPTIHSDK